MNSDTCWWCKGYYGCFSDCILNWRLEYSGNCFTSVLNCHHEDSEHTISCLDNPVAELTNKVNYLTNVVIELTIMLRDKQ